VGCRELKQTGRSGTAVRSSDLLSRLLFSDHQNGGAVSKKRDDNNTENKIFKSNGRIVVKPQHTYLAFWVIPYPANDADMMGVIWRDGDTGEYLGEARFRYYDPLDPANDAFSGKDRKHWYTMKFDKRPDLTEFKEQMMKVAQAVGGTLHWSDKERNGDEFTAYLTTFPWAHWGKNSRTNEPNTTNN
jgi:hypothetical protein